jgi:hypothetical protein
MKDLERCHAVDEPVWDEVEERALSWRVGVPVGLMLARVRHTLGVRVPRSLTKRLIGGRPAHSAVAVIDAAWPVRRASDRGSPSRLLARCARANVTDTRRELVTRLLELRSRNLGELVRPDTKRPRSSQLYRVDESDTGRAAFMASVSASTTREDGAVGGYAGEIGP